MADISYETRKLVGLKSETETYKDDNKSSNTNKKDERDVQKLVDILKSFNPFGRDTNDLVCISTNDVALTDVKEDLFCAKAKGAALIKEIVTKRLGESHTTPFHSAIPKNNLKIFATIHSIPFTSAAAK